MQFHWPSYSCGILFLSGYFTYSPKICFLKREAFAHLSYSDSCCLKNLFDWFNKVRTFEGFSSRFVEIKSHESEKVQKQNKTRKEKKLSVKDEP